MANSIVKPSCPAGQSASKLTVVVVVVEAPGVVAAGRPVAAITGAAWVSLPCPVRPIRTPRIRITARPVKPTAAISGVTSRSGRLSGRGAAATGRAGGGEFGGSWSRYFSNSIRAPPRRLPQFRQ